MVHKSNGARAGYLIFSGAVVMLVCMTGLVPTVLHWVPLAVVAMVIVWFGLVMVGSLSRKFRKTRRCRGAWSGAYAGRLGAAVGDLSLHKGGSNLFESAPKFGDELAIYGMIALRQASLLVSMLWAAALAWMFDCQFLHAALWLMVRSVLSCFGGVHAYALTVQGAVNKLGFWVAPAFSVSYAAGALLLVACHCYAARSNAALAVSH
jgi:AGZA family xanthine/uracil permease-like MFS transporter